MSYTVLSQVKKKEAIGPDIMPSTIMQNSNLQVDKKVGRWLITFQTGAMYQVKGTDRYVRKLEVMDGSEDALREALRTLDYTNWIGWTTPTALRAHYYAAHAMQTVSKRQPRPHDYVVDEDKSVRWNREQNQLYNDSIQAEMTDMMRQKDEAIRKVQEEIACHMVFTSEGAMSLTQARALWEIIGNTTLDFDEKMNLLDEMSEFWFTYVK